MVGLMKIDKGGGELLVTRKVISILRGHRGKNTLVSNSNEVFYSNNRTKKKKYTLHLPEVTA